MMKTKIGVISDLHLFNKTANIERALTKLHGSDLVLIVGDIADRADEKQYDIFQNLYDERFHDIITDGMENASKEYKLPTVKAMIEKQKKDFGWEFVFMGANIDAISVAGSIGIDASRAANYHADSVGTATNFVAVGKMFTSVRKGSSVADNWKEEIDKDYNSRKK